MTFKLPEPAAEVSDRGVLQWCLPTAVGNRTPKTKFYTHDQLLQALKDWSVGCIADVLTELEDSAPAHRIANKILTRAKELK